MHILMEVKLLPALCNYYFQFPFYVFLFKKLKGETYPYRLLNEHLKTSDCNEELDICRKTPTNIIN